MEKLKMHTQDGSDVNIRKIAELFPNCVTDGLVQNIPSMRLSKLYLVEVIKQRH